MNSLRYQALPDLPSDVKYAGPVFHIPRTGLVTFDDPIADSIKQKAQLDLSASGGDFVALFNNDDIFNRWESLKWFLAAGFITRASLPSLTDSCHSGNEDGARWLVHTFNYMNKVDFAEIIRCFHWSSENGRMNLVRFIVHTFDFSAEDVRAADNYALRKSYANGYLEVARWLILTCGLTQEDAPDIPASLFLPESS